ncbi:MAG: hypothetical protein H6603_00875 [Flavobacteriales bacterium]|nr:hypothetical protein [Flavobacteriales bacterium]
MKTLFRTSFAVAIIAIAFSGMTSCTKSVCDNTCSYAYDGTCDDGGQGSSYSLCDCGTDCADCGERTKRVGPGVPGSNCK